MPRKPEVKKFDATSDKIVNSILDSAIDGSPLSEITLRATTDTASLRAIGEQIMAFEPRQNAFLHALVNRIGRVILSSKLYSNPWARFKKGLLEYGETIEEIFVELARPWQFDPEFAETNQFKREIPDVRAVFHTMNFQKFYKSTVTNDELRQAFLSWQGITDLIAKIIDAMYTSAEFDEFLVMKYLILRHALNGDIHIEEIPEPTATNSDEIITIMRSVSNKLLFLSNEYSINNVHTKSDRLEQNVIVDSDTDAIVSVSSLAKAFNLEYAQFLGKYSLVDKFVFSADEIERLNLLFDGDPNYTPLTPDEIETAGHIHALLADDSAFMIYDNYNNFAEKYNGEGLYWNYWYHVWKTFSMSPYHSLVLFASGDANIDSVTIAPNTVSVAKGASTQLTATVVKTGLISDAVVWGLHGNQSPATRISSEGLITIGADETATTITATATAVADSTKTGSSVITVTDA